MLHASVSLCHRHLKTGSNIYLSFSASNKNSQAQQDLERPDSTALWWGVYWGNSTCGRRKHSNLLASLHQITTSQGYGFWLWPVFIQANTSKQRPGERTCIYIMNISQFWQNNQVTFHYTFINYPDLAFSKQNTGIISMGPNYLMCIYFPLRYGLSVCVLPSQKESNWNSNLLLNHRRTQDP